jgi:hypothetical protein
MPMASPTSRTCSAVKCRAERMTPSSRLAARVASGVSPGPGAASFRPMAAPARSTTLVERYAPPGLRPRTSHPQRPPSRWPEGRRSTRCSSTTPRGSSRWPTAPTRCSTADPRTWAAIARDLRGGMTARSVARERAPAASQPAAHPTRSSAPSRSPGPARWPLSAAPSVGPLGRSPSSEHGASAIRTRAPSRVLIRDTSLRYLRDTGPRGHRTQTRMLQAFQRRSSVPSLCLRSVVSSVRVVGTGTAPDAGRRCRRPWRCGFRGRRAPAPHALHSTQRKPMWLIPVSTGCGRRAAGR